MADGTVFEGRALGYEGETVGEVVFNTAMTGYQEILSDPSYKGQIITMTCPHIGNYGVTPEDIESRKIWAEGFVVMEASRLASNWRGKQLIQDYLAKAKVVAIEGLDTRALTRHLRETGSQQGVIMHGDVNRDSAVKKARQAPGILGRDLVAELRTMAIDQQAPPAADNEVRIGDKDMTWPVSTTSVVGRQQNPR